MTIPAIVCCYNSAGVAFASGAETPVVGNVRVYNGDVFSNIPIGVAGTFSLLSVRANATGTTRVVSLRKNAGAANQTISIGNGLSGIFTDVTNSDTAVAGDDWNYTSTEAGTDPTYYGIWMHFTATTGTAALAGNIEHSFNNISSARFWPVLGAESITTQSSDNNLTQHKIKAGATMRRFGGNVANQTAANSMIVNLRINGSNGNQSITVAASGTGIHEDTSNTDSVDADDLVSASMTPGADITYAFALTPFVTFEEDADRYDLFGGRPSTTRAASATVHYFPIIGTNGAASFGLTTESQAGIDLNFSETFNLARMALSANTYSANGTVRLRKNSADANQTITLTAGATGWFEDAVNTDAFADGEIWNYSITGGTSGSITAGPTAITVGVAAGGHPAIKRSGGVPHMASLRPQGGSGIRTW